MNHECVPCWFYRVSWTARNKYDTKSVQLFCKKYFQTLFQLSRMGFVMCGCFGNTKCRCIYCVFVLFRLCIFILCMLLFNFVKLCIFIVMFMYHCYVCSVMYILFSSATLTEVFPCFFLSCKASAKV